MTPASYHLTVAGPDQHDLASAFLHLVADIHGTLRDVNHTRYGGQVLMGAVITVADDVVENRLRTGLDALAARFPGITTRLEGRPELTLVPAEQAELTVLGAEVSGRAIDRLAETVEVHGGRVTGIRQVASVPVACVRLRFSEPDPPAALRTALSQDARALGVDVALHDPASRRHPKRLLVMDVDSTLIQAEMIDVLAAHAGRGDEVAAVTERAMQGELDFAESLRHRVALLEGLAEDHVRTLSEEVELMPGARTLVRTLKAHGYRIGIVSGGFTHVTSALARALGIDYAAANTLEVRDGVLTGRVVGEIVDRAGKARALEDFARREGVPLDQTVAIGDGANDLDMLARAGLGIAFNAKPVVRDAADASLSVPYLDAALYLLGLTRDAVVAAE